MAIEGVDYAWSKPTPAVLVAAGKQFACRYLSNPGNTKNLTPGEATALSDAGISIVSNWEWRAGDAHLGKAAGADYARQARAMATACGMPTDRPIYFSVDFGLMPSNVPAVRAYFEGIRSVLGRSGAGVYGGYDTIARAVAEGWCDWYWQTFAWSAGRWHPAAHIQQYRNGVTIGGADCDLNRAVRADYGQWRKGQQMSTTAENQVNSLFDAMFNGGTSMGAKVDPDGTGARPASNSVVAKLDAILTKLAQAPTPAPVTLDPAQLDALTDQVVAKLAAGTELAFRKATP